MYLCLYAYILKSVLQGEQKFGVFLMHLILVDISLLAHIDCISKESIVVAVHLTLKQEYFFTSNFTQSS